jgi:hypothetical protein
MVSYSAGFGWSPTQQAYFGLEMAALMIVAYGVLAPLARAARVQNNTLLRIGLVCNAVSVSLLGAYSKYQEFQIGVGLLTAPAHCISSLHQLS